MKNLRLFLLPLALFGACAATLAPNAMARDQIDWSISIGSPGYPAPPPVVYRQPPVVYAPPPVVYAPPPVVYAPRPVVPMVAPGVVYTSPGYVYDYGYRGRPWRGRDGHWHRHHKDRD